MTRFTEEQLKIAASLVKGTKTVPELREDTGIQMNELNKALAVMLKLKLVSKEEGFPTKYSIIEQVRRKAVEEENVERPFKAHMIVEGHSKSKEALEQAQVEILDKLRKDPIVLAKNIIEEVIEENKDDKDESFFSSVFEADVHAKSFEDLVYAVLTYGPSSVEMESPHEFTIKVDEAQSILMDSATVVHSYANMIGELHLQLQHHHEKFHKSS